MTKKRYDNTEGVWRTIGGRKVFIRKGQSLSDAMKESGKFKKASDVKRGQYHKVDKELKSERLDKEYTDRMDSFSKNGHRFSDWKKAEDKFQEKYENDLELGMRKGEFSNPRVKYTNDLDGKHINSEKYQKVSNAIKNSNDEEIRDMSRGWATLSGSDTSNKNEQAKIKELAKQELANRKGISKQEKFTYNNARDILNQLNDEGSDFTFGEIDTTNYVSGQDYKKIGKLKTDVSVFMPDERGYTGRELEIPISQNETSASFEEKIRDWQSRHNSPDSFYDEDFPVEKSKEKATRIKDIEKKLEDIEWQGERGARNDGHLNYNENYGTLTKEYKELTGKDYKAPFKQGVYKEKKSGNDYLPKATKITTQGKSNRKEVSDNIQAHILEHYDNPVDFMEQMDAMDYLPTRWKAGEEIARGGSYLIYNQDMADYLDTLGINPKGKKFSSDKSFDMYVSLVGRESDHLYTKMEKLFEQYKKEHKNSNASLDDFRKWFK